MKINNSKILSDLKLEKQNQGSSTGKNWFSSNFTINSYSPIDSSLIGSLTETNQRDYEKIISVAKKHLLILEKFQLQKEEN